MENSKYNTIFIILLYLLFTFISVSLLLVGGEVFSNISNSIDDNYDIRTSLSYVRVKLRQGDEKNNIYIDENNETPRLIIEEGDGRDIYQTIIYHYDGALYEMYIKKGVPFKQSDGDRIIDLEKLDFNIRDNLVEISTESKDGTTDSFFVALRTQ